MLSRQNTPRRGSRRAFWRDSEAGLNSIEAAILMPVVIALLFGIVQATIFFHARNVASAAAQVAVQAAAAYDGSAGAGQAAGATYLANVGGINNAGVSVSRGAQTTTATVTGKTAPLVPGMPLPTIKVSAQAATERLSSP